MRALACIAVSLFTGLAVAQAGAEPAGGVWVFGEVQHGRLPVGGGHVSVRELLIRAKPRPQADLERVEVLRLAARKFAVELVAAADDVRVEPGGILLVPRMRNAGAGTGVPFVALEAALRAEPGPGRAMALRLYLLRRHPDPAVRCLQAKAIGAARDAGDAVPALAEVLVDARGPLLDAVFDALGSMKSGLFGARDALAGLRAHPRSAVRERARRLFARTLCAVDCFPAGTLVQTPAGAVRIEALHVGDALLDGQGRRTTVAGTHTGHALELVVIDAGGASVRATPGHRFQTARGWWAAGDLREGDLLGGGAREGGTLVTGARRVVETRPVVVYNLRTLAGSFRVGTRGLVVEAQVRAPGERRDAGGWRSPRRRP